jgi:hypothetical protein
MTASGKGDALAHTVLGVGGVRLKKSPITLVAGRYENGEGFIPIAYRKPYSNQRMIKFKHSSSVKLTIQTHLREMYHQKYSFNQQKS